MLPWSADLAGRIDEQVIDSELLRGNPLGDPHERPLYVYLPPGYDAEPGRRYPTVYVIQGYTNATGDYTTWAPSPTMKLATALPLWKTDTGMLPVQLRLTANSDPGGWAIDDIYIDPYAR